MKTVLGDEAKVSQYATTLKQLAFNKNLANCNIDSVLKTGFEIVLAGLNPNPLFGQAYVVPYGKNAQLQIGYKGWIALGYRYGWRFRAVAVYDMDKFSMEFGGLTDKYNLEPNWDEREDDNGNWVYEHLRGVIVYARDKHNNEYSEFVSFRKLEKIRKKNEFQADELEEKLTSKNGKKFNNLWFEWAEEMYKAKALKYVITRLPIQEEIMGVTVKEDEPLREEQQQQKPKQAQVEQPTDPLKAFADDTIEADVEEQKAYTKEELVAILREAYKQEADATKKAEIAKVAQADDTDYLLNKCYEFGLIGGEDAEA